MEERDTGEGWERDLLARAQSGHPKAGKKGGLSPLPELSMGSVSCTALPMGISSVTLSQNPELPTLHLPFSVPAVGSGRGWLSLFPVLSLMFSSTNLWISSQASSRCWEGRIQRRNKPGREKGLGVIPALSEQLPLSQPSSELRVDFGRIPLTLPELDALGLHGGPDHQGVV